MVWAEAMASEEAPSDNLPAKGSAPFRIRDYQDKDKSSVIDLLSRALRDAVQHSKLYSRCVEEHFEQANDLDDIRGTYCAVSSFGRRGFDEVVGCIGLLPVSSDVAEIKRLTRLETWRRLGVATLLVQHAEEFARSTGFSRLELSTLAALRDAKRFYLRCGYTIYKEIDHQEITDGFEVKRTLHFCKTLV